MKNLKNKRTIILSVILLGLLVVAYKVIFVSPSQDPLVEENIAASANAEAILQQVESINFDTSVIKDQILKSLKSIESPIILLPVGRQNPFSGTGVSN
jgi:hypothetical protein